MNSGWAEENQPVKDTKKKKKSGQIWAESK